LLTLPFDLDRITPWTTDPNGSSVVPQPPERAPRSTSAARRPSQHENTMTSFSTTRPVRLAIVLCTVVSIGAPAIARAQAVDSAAPKPFEAFSNSAHSLRDSVVAMARAQVGTKYKHGGTTPGKGFDCSGLIQYVMAALKVDVPRTAKQQANVGLAVNRDTSRLLPGDLLTFGKGKKGVVSHIGIYVGDGRFIHASSVAGKVIESPIDRPASPLIKIWRGARRMMSLDDSVVTATAATVGTVNKGG
jgi:cell wall-associated NlpC family hydrolase